MENKIDFEALVKRLDELTNKIASGDLSLDESLALYQEGKDIISLLHKKLDEAESKVEKIIESK